LGKPPVGFTTDVRLASPPGLGLVLRDFAFDVIAGTAA